MVHRPKYLIGAALAVTAAGREAPAQPAPAADPVAGPISTTAAVELTDEELRKLSEEGEHIEIFDERPDKPFDRDTEVRLTGEQLAARGAVDLATALALLPDVIMRDAGRGGFNLDIRGARRGAVAVFVDGVLVTDPFYGTFDVSTIPITDIVQIRIATTPLSPIDGPNGTGGVVEVLTRDAVGSQLVVARLTSDSLPSFGMTGTARVALAKHVGLRVSASGLAGARDMELPGDTTIGEGRRAASGALRLEYRKGDRRLYVDGFVDDRHYLAPPSPVDASNLLMIDRETTTRALAKYDDKLGKLQILAQGWAHYLHRRSRNYGDANLESITHIEDLAAVRTGTRALVTKPWKKDFRWAASATVDREEARVVVSGGDTSRGSLTLIELALDGQYERERLRVDVAGGAAVPIGVGADPWPEAKLVGKYRPLGHLELTATGAYKGRTPTLRERYDAASGNPALGPEKVLHAELRAIESIARLRIEVAPFYKQTDGTIRASSEVADMGRFVNLGELDFYGVDTQAKVEVVRDTWLGGSYNYVRAKAPMVEHPIPRLPRHRFDAWIQGIYGSFNGLVRARYFGQAFEEGGATAGYLLVEASLATRLAKSYLLVLRVDDALDVRPETRVGFYGPGRVVSAILQGTWE